MKKIFAATLLIIFCFPVNAEIYTCQDNSGNTVFRDNECGSNERTIRVTKEKEYPKKEQAEEEKKEEQPVFEDDGKPGKLIFRSKSALRPPYKIRVDEVRVITETEDTLVVDVIYTYKHHIPAEEVKIYVTPNHGFWSTPSIKAEKGTHVARASIGLSRSNMKKKHKTRSKTTTLKIRFEHYKPKKYMGVIWSETVKYKKKWRLLN